MYLLSQVPSSHNRCDHSLMRAIEGVSLQRSPSIISSYSFQLRPFIPKVVFGPVTVMPMNSVTVDFRFRSLYQRGYRCHISPSEEATCESDRVSCLLIVTFTNPTVQCCPPAAPNSQAPPKAPPTPCWVQTPALVLGCLVVKPDLPTGFRHTPGHQPWDWNKLLFG